MCCVLHVDCGLLLVVLVIVVCIVFLFIVRSLFIWLVVLLFLVYFCGELSHRVFFLRFSLLGWFLLFVVRSLSIVDGCSLCVVRCSKRELAFWCVLCVGVVLCV